MTTKTNKIAFIKEKFTSEEVRDILLLVGFSSPDPIIENYADSVINRLAEEARKVD